MRAWFVVICLWAGVVGAAVYPGNGNSGFGGPIGGGTLEITNDAFNLYFTLTRGGDDLNDFLVLYIDSMSGGESNTSTYNYNPNVSQGAVSGLSFDGSVKSLVQFPPGFKADYAITVDATVFGNSVLYELIPGGPGTFPLLSFDPTPGMFPASATFSWSVPCEFLGLTPGDTFTFVGTYLNAGSAFRSDEAFGGGIAPGNPGQNSVVTFTSGLDYTLPKRAAFDTINYQGRLVVSNQLANGLHDMEFRLFSTNTGGIAVYAETQSVAVVDGLYSIRLGTFAPSNAPLRDTILAMPTYLEVTVDGQTLSPREPISSVPYAMLSESMPPASISSDMLRTAAVTSDKLAAGSVTANALAAGSVTANAIQGASITGEKIAPFSITGASINFSTIHGDRIINESLTGTDILNGSLTGADLASGTISNSALAANAVTGNTIADGTVSNIDLAVDAVTSLTVADGSVSNVDLAANAVTSDRIQDGTLTADDVASNTFWSTLGNAGTETGTHFLGTTDGRPLEIRAAGVGIGTTNPAGSLHVASGTVNAPAPSSGTVLVLERAGANYISMLAQTNSEQGILFGDSNDSVEGAIMFNSPGVTNGLQFRTLNNITRMTIDSAGRVGIGTTTPTNLLHVAGTVQATAYITGSDRNMKENIAPVSPDTILEKVAALPIATWTFKDEPNGTHIGPMAQDFHAAFGFGNTDTGIMTVDADGVALAAIQALAREREAMKDEVSVFGVRVSELEEENARLRADLEMIKGKLGL